MGLRATLAGIAWATTQAHYPQTPEARGRVALKSPWDVRSLNPVVFADLFGTDLDQMSRAQAMTIPGVVRGRGILLSLIADKPLVQYRGSDRITDQPAWLYRSLDLAGPTQRMADTIDDLIFYPWSLWGCRRGVSSSGIKPILEAWHIDYDSWEVDELDRICLLDEDGHYTPADADEVILIPGPWEGLLANATRTLVGAADLERTWISRAKNPIPAIELHETVASDMDETEAADFVRAWATARLDPNGAVAYTPWNIEAKALGQYSPDMFIEARNAARLDLAAFFQLPGSLLDASTATASLTYVTQEGQASSLDTLTVPYWARHIEGRLSQDDVVPQGNIVRFAWGEAYTEPQGRIVTGDQPAAVRDTAADTQEVLA